MKYDITHTTKYTYSEAVPVCQNLVRLAPRSLPYQSCHHFQLLIHPEPFELDQRHDYFGNQVAYFSIEQAHMGLTITSKSEVEVHPIPNPEDIATPAWEEVVLQLKNGRTSETLDACQFVFGSPADHEQTALTEFARQSFPPGAQILAGVRDLTRRIFKDFEFDSQATTVHTPVEEVFENRRGVCQDFTRLQIACLRNLGLAARYVSGYLRTIPPPGKPRLVGADASHAWVSVFCGNAGWVDFDPTNNTLITTDHITVAYGRDFQDVSPIQGVIVGGGEHMLEVSVDVVPEGPPLR